MIGHGAERRRLSARRGEVRLPADHGEAAAATRFHHAAGGQGMTLRQGTVTRAERQDRGPGNRSAILPTCSARKVCGQAALATVATTAWARSRSGAAASCIALVASAVTR